MTRRAANRKGFSLLEIIFAMFMVGLLMTFGMIYLKGGAASADSHSLALVPAEAQRVARQTAITTQEPVAVMLPTSNGSTPIAQSLYVATAQEVIYQPLSGWGSTPYETQALQTQDRRLDAAHFPPGPRPTSFFTSAGLVGCVWKCLVMV